MASSNHTLATEQRIQWTKNAREMCVYNENKSRFNYQNMFEWTKSGKSQKLYANQLFQRTKHNQLIKVFLWKLVALNSPCGGIQNSTEARCQNERINKRKRKVVQWHFIFGKSDRKQKKQMEKRRKGDKTECVWFWINCSLWKKAQKGCLLRQKRDKRLALSKSMRTMSPRISKSIRKPNIQFIFHQMHFIFALYARKAKANRI